MTDSLIDVVESRDEVCGRQFAGGVVRPHAQLRQGTAVNLNTDVELLDYSNREAKELERERGIERERGGGEREMEGERRGGQYTYECASQHQQCGWCDNIYQGLIFTVEGKPILKTVNMCVLGVGVGRIDWLSIASCDKYFN